MNDYLFFVNVLRLGFINNCLLNVCCKSYIKFARKLKQDYLLLSDDFAIKEFYAFNSVRDHHLNTYLA